MDDYQDMFSHYQAAEKVLTDEKGAYQALLQEVLTCLSSPHYYTVLTTPQLRQQAMSLAQALAQVANDSAVTQAHALQRAEQACERARSRDEKVQGQLETARKKWVRKQVEVIAHTLNHKPLLDYLAGKDRGYINEKDAQGRTALHCAVAQNQPDFVQWLLDHGADVEVQDADKCTPLHWAAQWGYSDMAAMILVHGAAIESQDSDGFTPLHWAAQKGHTAIVELLLEKGAAIEAQDEAGLTPLHTAVQQGHTDTVELLLTRGANKEAQDSAGCTPLHWAAQQSHPVIAELLLVRGADPTAKDAHGKTPRTVAISKGHQLEDPNRKALLKKVEEMARSLRHWPLLYYLARKGPQYINEQDAQGKTALWHAIDRNETDIVQWLLDHGADGEVQDADECTPLHWAAKNGHTAIVERLLKKGADTEARGLCEFTPLRYAVREGNEYTATLPPRHNEKVEAGDAEKNCPLHYAAAEGHKTIVELLLAHGANKDAQGSCACTPLHYAVWEDHKDVAALLLDHGAKIEIQDTAKHTPLHYAACKGHTAIVELLLARGAAAGAKDKFGITPLAIAIAKRHEAVATLLRAAQVPSRPSSYPLTVSVEDEAKNTDESIEKEDLIALHYAINQGPKSVVATPLVNKKAAIDEKVWKVSHHAGSPKKYFGGIPNVGNTCYLNAALQIIARLYPDLVGHPHDYLGKDGQAIVNKLTSNDPEQRVTEQEATAFRNDLINSYNQGKSTMEQLRHSAQEDVAPVLSFLLQKGRIQEIAFYATKNPVGDDAYTPTMADSPSTGQFITVNLPSTGTGESMDRLVESTLRGNLVEDTVWERDGQVTRGRAEVGTKLSMKNLQGLTHKIVPICAHRFVQTSNQHSGTASKIETPITNPFKLTIAEKYLIGEAAYTSSLVGFIYHAGDLNSGHYMV